MLSGSDPKNNVLSTIDSKKNLLLGDYPENSLAYYFNAITLEYSPEKNWDDIRAGYKKAVSIWHTDKNKASDAKEKLEKAQKAYAFLRNLYEDKYEKLNDNDKITFLQSLFSINQAEQKDFLRKKITSQDSLNEIYRICINGIKPLTEILKNDPNNKEFKEKIEKFTFIKEFIKTELLLTKPNNDNLSFKKSSDCYGIDFGYLNAEEKVNFIHLLSSLTPKEQDSIFKEQENINLDNLVHIIYQLDQLNSSSPSPKITQAKEKIEEFIANTSIFYKMFFYQIPDEKKVNFFNGLGLIQDEEKVKNIFSWQKSLYHKMLKEGNNPNEIPFYLNEMKKKPEYNKGAIEKLERLWKEKSLKDELFDCVNKNIENIGRAGEILKAHPELINAISNDLSGSNLLMTALKTANRQAHPSRLVNFALDYLIDKNIDLTLQNEDGNTALHLSASFEDKDFQRVTLKILEKMELKSREALENLINVRNGENRTPRENDKFGVISAFLEKINQPEYMLFEKFKQKDFKSAANILESNPELISIKFEDGTSPLMKGIELGSFEIVDTCIHNAKIAQKDLNNLLSTAIQKAGMVMGNPEQLSGYIDIIISLIDAGAERNADIKSNLEFLSEYSDKLSKYIKSLEPKEKTPTEVEKHEEPAGAPIYQQWRSENFAQKFETANSLNKLYEMAKEYNNIYSNVKNVEKLSKTDEDLHIETLQAFEEQLEKFYVIQRIQKLSDQIMDPKSSQELSFEDSIYTLSDIADAILKYQNWNKADFKKIEETIENIKSLPEFSYLKFLKIDFDTAKNDINNVSILKQAIDKFIQNYNDYLNPYIQLASEISAITDKVKHQNGTKSELLNLMKELKAVKADWESKKKIYNITEQDFNNLVYNVIPSTTQINHPLLVSKGFPDHILTTEDITKDIASSIHILKNKLAELDKSLSPSDAVSQLETIDPSISTITNEVQTTHGYDSGKKSYETWKSTDFSEKFKKSNSIEELYNIAEEYNNLYLDIILSYYHPEQPPAKENKLHADVLNVVRDKLNSFIEDNNQWVTTKNTDNAFFIARLSIKPKTKDPRVFLEKSIERLENIIKVQSQYSQDEKNIKEKVNVINKIKKLLTFTETNIKPIHPLEVIDTNSLTSRSNLLKEKLVTEYNEYFKPYKALAANMADINIDISKQQNLTPSDLVNAIKNLTSTLKIKEDAFNNQKDAYSNMLAWKSTIDKKLSSILPTTNILSLANEDALIFSINKIRSTIVKLKSNLLAKIAENNKIHSEKITSHQQQLNDFRRSLSDGPAILKLDKKTLNALKIQNDSDFTDPNIYADIFQGESGDNAFVSQQKDFIFYAKQFEEQQKEVVEFNRELEKIDTLHNNIRDTNHSLGNQIIITKQMLQDFNSHDLTLEASIKVLTDVKTKMDKIENLCSLFSQQAMDLLAINTADEDYDKNIFYSNYIDSFISDLKSSYLTAVDITTKKYYSELKQILVNLKNHNISPFNDQHLTAQLTSIQKDLKSLPELNSMPTADRLSNLVASLSNILQIQANFDFRQDQYTHGRKKHNELLHFLESDKSSRFKTDLMMLGSISNNTLPDLNNEKASEEMSKNISSALTEAVTTIKSTFEKHIIEKWSTRSQELQNFNANPDISSAERIVNSLYTWSNEYKKDEPVLTRFLTLLQTYADNKEIESLQEFKTKFDNIKISQQLDNAKKNANAYLKHYVDFAARVYRTYDLSWNLRSRVNAETSASIRELREFNSIKADWPSIKDNYLKMMAWKSKGDTKYVLPVDIESLPDGNTITKYIETTESDINELKNSLLIQIKKNNEAHQKNIVDAKKKLSEFRASLKDKGALLALVNKENFDRLKMEIPNPNFVHPNTYDDIFPGDSNSDFILYKKNFEKQENEIVEFNKEIESIISSFNNIKNTNHTLTNNIAITNDKLEKFNSRKNQTSDESIEILSDVKIRMNQIDKFITEFQNNAINILGLNADNYDKIALQSNYTDSFYIDLWKNHEKAKEIMVNIYFSELRKIKEELEDKKIFNFNENILQEKLLSINKNSIFINKTKNDSQIVSENLSDSILNLSSILQINSNLDFRKNSYSESIKKRDAIKELLTRSDERMLFNNAIKNILPDLSTYPTKEDEISNTISSTLNAAVSIIHADLNKHIHDKWNERNEKLKAFNTNPNLEQAKEILNFIDAWEVDYDKDKKVIAQIQKLPNNPALGSLQTFIQEFGKIDITLQIDNAKKNAYEVIFKERIGHLIQEAKGLQTQFKEEEAKLENLQNNITSFLNYQTTQDLNDDFFAGYLDTYDTENIRIEENRNTIDSSINNTDLKKLASTLYNGIPQELTEEFKTIYKDDLSSISLLISQTDNTLTTLSNQRQSITQDCEAIKNNHEAIVHCDALLKAQGKPDNRVNNAVNTIRADVKNAEAAYLPDKTDLVSKVNSSYSDISKLKFKLQNSSFSSTPGEIIAIDKSNIKVNEQIINIHNESLFTLNNTLFILTDKFVTLLQTKNQELKNKVQFLKEPQIVQEHLKELDKVKSKLKPEFSNKVNDLFQNKLSDVQNHLILFNEINQKITETSDMKTTCEKAHEEYTNAVNVINSQNELLREDIPCWQVIVDAHKEISRINALMGDFTTETADVLNRIKTDKAFTQRRINNLEEYSAEILGCRELNEFYNGELQKRYIAIQKKKTDVEGIINNLKNKILENEKLASNTIDKNELTKLKNDDKQIKINIQYYEYTLLPALDEAETDIDNGFRNIGRIQVDLNDIELSVINKLEETNENAKTHEAKYLLSKDYKNVDGDIFLDIKAQILGGSYFDNFRNYTSPNAQKVNLQLKEKYLEGIHEAKDLKALRKAINKDISQNGIALSSYLGNWDGWFFGKSKSANYMDNLKKQLDKIITEKIDEVTKKASHRIKKK